MGQKTEELKAICASLGRKYVGFRGNPRSPLWFIGEAPGADEDQAGVPFVGSSGRELDRMIVEAGISLGDCCFTNPYKVRPPNNDIEKIEETCIAKQLFEAQFFEELNEYRPPFLVALGGTPLRLLCDFTIDPRDKESKISKWRGSLLTSNNLGWPHYVLPNFHPAYILREWSDRDVAVFIFRRLREEFEYWRSNAKHQPLPERELIVEPSYEVAREFLNELIATDRPVAADIELLARRVPICIALSNDPARALSLSLLDGEPGTQASLWRLLDTILSKKRIVGQNWTTFDANWLQALGFQPGVALCDDTLVRHHVLHPEMSHKLDFQVMQYSREPYYKDEGKGWSLREGFPKLKRYNCKDAACDLEVFYEQEKEFKERPELKEFYNYEMSLARSFFKIDQRGLQTDPIALAGFRNDVIRELGEACVKISTNLKGRAVAYSAKMANKLAKELNIEPQQVLNISSVPQLKDVLKNELKIKLKIDKKTHKESTGEDSLNEAFAATNNPVLKDVLRTRELNKMLGTYIDSKRSNGVFYSCYSVTGTVTGRRASRKNFLGFGSNGQNQPKHSDLGKRFRGVFVARPGKILISCDQAYAEDWVVQGIIADVSGNTAAIEELRSGVDRHQRLAAQIFGLPLAQCGKDTMERYLGKKTRHAGNYGMGPEKMSTEMAKEGYSVSKQVCAAVLSRFHEIEPHIRGVFHKWVENELRTTRRLTTPLGRSRDFFGLRPFGDNRKIFQEAYAYVPQSTVGDNTGKAILFCEQNRPGLVLQDGHDAILLEVEDSFEELKIAFRLLQHAFNRVIKFQNRFELQIPIEFEIGYDLKGMKRCPEGVETGLLRIYNTLKEQRSLQASSISGVQSLQLPPRSNDTSGSTEPPGSFIPISSQSSSPDQVSEKEQL